MARRERDLEGRWHFVMHDGRPPDRELMEHGRLGLAEPTAPQVDALSVQAVLRRERSHRLTGPVESGEDLARVLGLRRVSCAND